MQILLSHLRFAFRQLLKNPAFTVHSPSTLRSAATEDGLWPCSRWRGASGRILLEQTRLAVGLGAEMKPTSLPSRLTVCVVLSATGVAQASARTDDRGQGWRSDLVLAKAVFAREPSGAKPNFVGGENPVKLPRSGAVANIANHHHETIPGDTREWIEPEINACRFHDVTIQRFNSFNER
ncbi:MAG: hypothetical protein HYY24_23305 [Verrucomicrobia bacterium]|nr:hypothetical protein [Verrucomicrobiota bacterium]